MTALTQPIFEIVFQTEDTHTLGAIYASPAERKKLAEKSLETNLRNKIVLELFPEICEVNLSKKNLN